MKLFSYYRSSSAWRVRIALSYKGIPHGTVPVHLVRDGGQQHSESYHEMNPQELVPALVDEDLVIGQAGAKHEIQQPAGLAEQARPALVF